MFRSVRIVPCLAVVGAIALAAVTAGKTAPVSPKPVAGKQGPRTVLDSIVAAVGDREITKQEIDWIVNERMAKLPKTLSPAARARYREQIREKAFRQRVDELLLEQLAEEEGVQVDEDIVQEVVARDLKAFKSKEALLREQFPHKLGRLQEVTIEDYESVIRTRAKIQTVLGRKIGPPRFITPRELARRYKKNRALYSQEEQVMVRQVLIRYKSGGKKPRFKNYKEALAFAQGLRRKVVKEKAPFETIAAKHSDGPYRSGGGLVRPSPDSDGWVKKGVLFQAIEEAAFALKPGTVSGIIEMDLVPGDKEKEIYFIKVEKRKKARQMTFKEVQDRIRTEIRTREQTAKRDRILKELRRKNPPIMFKPRR